jgi:hypothetical protein
MHHISSKNLLPLSLLLICFLAACGEGLPEASFPVEQTRPLSDLTSEERGLICEEIRQVYATAITKSEVCTLAGLAIKTDEGSGEQQCSQVYKLCLDQEVTIPAPDWECGVLSTEQTRSCTATVSELEACVNDELRLMKQVLSGLSCSSSLESLEDRLREPPSCQRLESQCPTLSI